MLGSQQLRPARFSHDPLDLWLVGPVGTVVDIGGAKTTIALDEGASSQAMTPLTIDLSKRLADAPLGPLAIDAKTGAYLTVPAKIVTDTTKKTALKIAASGIAPVFRVAFAPLTKGPVTFDGDEPAGPIPRSLLYVGLEAVRFFGPDTTPRGVDLVALAQASRAPWRRAARTSARPVRPRWISRCMQLLRRKKATHVGAVIRRRFVVYV